MIFNYKRVSTISQNTERQLLNIPCDREYEDKISGKDRNRPQLEMMMGNIRSGDVVNVHSMDRLARNTRDLLNLVEEINNKEETYKYVNDALKNGYVQETGTAINEILPKMSRFNKSRSSKKSTVLDRIIKFFNRFKDIASGKIEEN